jgi:hypothetical protein
MILISALTFKTPQLAHLIFAKLPSMLSDLLKCFHLKSLERSLERLYENSRCLISDSGVQIPGAL